MIDEPEALSNAPNSYELDGRYLGSITEDFVKVSELIQEASHQIRQRGFSSYPVFVVSPEKPAIGTLLIAANEMDNNVHFYAASMLEEFTQREIIGEDGEELFKQTYKDPSEFACIFMVDTNFTRFIFVPYPED